MCDYSLANFPNRLAEEGEMLVVHRFPGGTKGLVSPENSDPKLKLVEWFLKPLSPQLCAVCIPPGARLLLRDIPERLQQQLGVAVEEEAVFTQLSAEAYEHRDAVRFTNGREVLLQTLALGQRVQVLHLSPDEQEIKGDLVRLRQ